MSGLHLPIKSAVNPYQLDSQSGATLAKWETVTLQLQPTMQMARCVALSGALSSFVSIILPRWAQCAYLKWRS